MTTNQLDALADALAERVAERLAERMAELSAPRLGPPMIDAAEAARRLGVSRETVYALAAELGAVKLGTGSKPRLRFDQARVDAYIAGPAEPAEQPRSNGAPRGSRKRRPSGELLPIKGMSTHEPRET